MQPHRAAQGTHQATDGHIYKDILTTTSAQQMTCMGRAPSTTRTSPRPTAKGKTRAAILLTPHTRPSMPLF